MQNLKFSLAFKIFCNFKEILVNVELGFTKEDWNTQYAPLAVLFNYYQHNDILKPLESVNIKMKTRDFSSVDKLKQILLSIMCGCDTFSAINTSLRHEDSLAKSCGWDKFADQSNLSRNLDSLSPVNIEELRKATKAIYRPFSQLKQHDWRKSLWLDFDLTGLVCGKLGEASQKGYFSGKKTLRVDN